MKEHITPQIKANEIRMESAVHTGVFLVVEGPSDKRTYRNFMNPKLCKIIVGHDKENVIKIMEILDNASFDRALAIVDADFDILEERFPKSKNVFLTDTHDQETMMLKSKALNKVLVILGSEDKISVFVGNKVRKEHSIRRHLLRCGVFIGYLRWVSFKEGLCLCFKELSYHKFVVKRTLLIDLDKLIRNVKNNTPYSEISDSELKQKVKDLSVHKYDPWLVCNGHDLIHILVEGLCDCLGTRTKTNLPYDTLRDHLSIGFEFNYFKKTQLYNSMKSWEEAHSPFLAAS